MARPYIQTLALHKNRTNNNVVPDRSLPGAHWRTVKLELVLERSRVGLWLCGGGWRPCRGCFVERFQLVWEAGSSKNLRLVCVLEISPEAQDTGQIRINDGLWSLPSLPHLSHISCLPLGTSEIPFNCCFSASKWQRVHL